MNCSKEKNKKILILDDEVDILEFLRIYLETMGWEVTAAATVSQALDELAKQPFFLTITDIAMPDMDGYEFINEVRARGYKCRLALMTGFGYDRKHTLVKIYQTEKYPLLFKPFNREKVMETVNEAYALYHGETDGAGGDSGGE